MNVVEDGKSYRHLMIRVFGCRCRGKQGFSDIKNLEDYQTGSGDISVSEAINCFNAHLGSSFSDLNDDELRVQLTER